MEKLLPKNYTMSKENNTVFVVYKELELQITEHPLYTSFVIMHLGEDFPDILCKWECVDNFTQNILAAINYMYIYQE